MNYNQRQFLTLIQTVEDSGGEHLDEMCVARQYDFSGEKSKPVTLAGCGNMSLFEVPYESENGLQPIKLCAVCDDLGLMPRFAGAMTR